MMYSYKNVKSQNEKAGWGKTPYTIVSADDRTGVVEVTVGSDTRDKRTLRINSLIDYIVAEEAFVSNLEVLKDSRFFAKTLPKDTNSKKISILWNIKGKIISTEYKIPDIYTKNKVYANIEQLVLILKQLDRGIQIADELAVQCYQKKGYTLEAINMYLKKKYKFESVKTKQPDLCIDL